MGHLPRARKGLVTGKKERKEEKGCPNTGSQFMFSLFFPILPPLLSLHLNRTDLFFSSSLYTLPWIESFFFFFLFWLNPSEIRAQKPVDIVVVILYVRNGKKRKRWLWRYRRHKMLFGKRQLRRDWADRPGPEAVGGGGGFCFRSAAIHIEHHDKVRRGGKKKRCIEDR